MLESRLNARVLLAADASAVVQSAHLEGMPARDIARLAAGVETWALALEQVTGREADLLRKRMAETGGQALVLPGKAPAADAADAGLVLVGSRAQFQALSELLRAETEDLAAIGEVIRDALAAYGLREFDVGAAGGRRLKVGPAPALMGVVNVTPDSFSDGGQFATARDAVDHARRLVDEGADLLDIGGESTRPGSDPLAEEDELARVMPVIEGLAGKVRVPLSIDTRHSRVARRAVAAGAAIINDVTGLRGDPDMAAACAETGAAVVIMHMLGTPRTMQQEPRYDNLMADICRYLRRGMAIAREAGVPDDRLLVDPGIGFGKTLEHNLEILARLGQLRTLGRPILVGPSRKQFIGLVTGVERPSERTFGTVGACALAVAAGALLLRVHDVAEVRQAAAVAAAIARAGERVS